jgi:flagellar biosynthesis GTPase FlhF
MKKTPLILILLAFMAMKTADIFSDLGISKEQAQEYVANNITTGYLNFPNNARKIPLSGRASIVQAIGVFAKNYVKTEDFKSRYAEWWKSQEPTKPQTPEEKIADQKRQEEESKKEQANGLDNLKKQIAETKDAAMKKQLQEILDMSIKMQADMKTQMESPDYKKSMKDAMEMMQKMEAEQYTNDLMQYQEKYKEWQEAKNPTVVLKKDLQKFLTETEGIDFNAQLITDQNGKKEFTKAEYVQKGAYWKQSFRAGKPTIDAARTIAQEWLKEL